MKHSPSKWRKIAEAFDTPYEERTEEQMILTRYGLCWAWQHAFPRTAQEGDAAHFMYRSWPDAWSVGHSGFAMPWRGYDNPMFRGEYDQVRATFAGLFAAMTQEDWDRLWVDDKCE